MIWPSNNPGRIGLEACGMWVWAIGLWAISDRRFRAIEKGFPKSPTTNPQPPPPTPNHPTTKPPNTNPDPQPRTPIPQPPSTNPQPIPHSQEARLHFQKRVLLKICTAEVLSGDTDRLEGHCCWQLKDEKSLIISLDAWTNGTLTSCRSPMHIRAWKCQFHACPESSREFRWRKKWIKALNHIKSTRYQQLPVTVEI